jgi:hypothetical protein
MISVIECSPMTDQRRNASAVIGSAPIVHFNDGDGRHQKWPNDGAMAAMTEPMRSRNRLSPPRGMGVSFLTPACALIGARPNFYVRPNGLNQIPGGSPSHESDETEGARAPSAGHATVV